MITVFSVLWGDKYPPEYVTRLRRMVRKNLTVPHQFICITDQNVPGVVCMRPPCDFPGWWQKIGLFKPGVAKGTSMFLDLDVVVCGELDSLVSKYGSSRLAAPIDWSQGTIATPFILWNPCPQVDSIWRKFDKDVMKRLHGDQNWVDEIAKNWFHEIAPPQICSYKWHVRVPRGTGTPPDRSRVVCFHGLPNPADVAHQHKWIEEAWT